LPLMTATLMLGLGRVGSIPPVWAYNPIRMTGGNFRLLTRLLTQIERVLSVNDLHLVSTAVVEAARDSLVIGPG
jgi:hypothetical protein